MKKQQKTLVVKNPLVNAEYKLTTIEQKIVLYVATLIKPNTKDFETFAVPAIVLAKALNHKGFKGGSFYKRLDDILESIMSKNIKFPSEVKNMNTRISWFSKAEPAIVDGQIVINFRFDPELKDYLLQLKRDYTKYHYKEIVQLKSRYAIRLFQLLKSNRDKQKGHISNTAHITYSLEELRAKLGLTDSHKLYKNFKRKVILIAQKQLQENTSISFDFKEKKNGRKVVGITFSVSFNTPLQSLTERNLFNLPDFDENQLDDLGKQVYEKVEKWGITPKRVMEICKSKSQDYIFEMIEYTKKNIEGKKIKNPAGYFIKALQENWIDQEIIDKKAKEERARIKREKAKKKKELGQELAQILKEKQDAKRQIYEELIEENHELVSIFLKETLTQIPFLRSYVNIGLSDIENYKKTKMLQANIDSKIEEKYPKKFEKVNKKYLPKINSFEQQIKELEN